MTEPWEANVDPADRPRQAKQATCNLCAKEPFVVPAPMDPVGVALMKQHMLERHAVRIGEFSLEVMQP